MFEVVPSLCVLWLSLFWVFEGALPTGSWDLVTTIIRKATIRTLAYNPN